MPRTIILTTAVLVMFFAACRAPKPTPPGAKNFSEFFLAEATKFGATPLTTNAPPLLIDWQSEEDNNGLQVRTAKPNFPAIENLLKTLFGNPRMPVAKGDGIMMGVYAVRDCG